MRTPILPFLTLLLAACGGGQDASDRIPESLVVYLDLVHDIPNSSGAGRYERHGADGFVWVRWDTYNKAATVTHELGHALGLGHGFGPPCVMAGTASLDLCPAEVAAASPAPFPMTLVPLNSSLTHYTQTAAAAWNAALGREQFVLSP